MINKPAVARVGVNFDTDEKGNSFKAVSTACELIAVVVSAMGSAAAVRFYDARQADQVTTGNQRLMVAANTGESTPFCPAQPIPFKNGLWIVFEQGGTPWGGEVSIVIN